MPCSGQAMTGIHRPSTAETAASLWTSIAEELGVTLDGPLNMAAIAVDRHIAAGHGERIAFRIVHGDDRREELSYRDLAQHSQRFAHALAQLGLVRGDCIFLLCERCTALYVAVIGALRLGLIVSPLFPAFGPEPIRNRIAQAKGKLLLTTHSAYRRKLAPIREQLASLQHIVIIDDLDTALPPATLDWEALLAAAPATPIQIATTAADAALLHFTSGTTGTPKGALHVHQAILSHYATARQALDLQSSDIFWCTADPGWVTGISYGILAPLAVGATSVVDAADFDPVRWLGILEDERVNVWYTAPTALRLLFKGDANLFTGRRFPDLRIIASVGEPLNAELISWAEARFGIRIRDTWWQSETGSIMLANLHSNKPGALGQPLPGIVAHIMPVRDASAVDQPPSPEIDGKDETNAVGELALETPWPSLFHGYLGQPQRTRDCFAGPLYLSGDLVRRDADGDFWFLGRRDDVIKSAGHLVGPCEIERVLMAHPAVAEAAVIGKPDALAGETIQAFVTLRQGHFASAALRSELLAHARRLLGPALAPREIAFAECLPHTHSGKIMRRLLKARALGEAEGDRSMLA